MHIAALRHPQLREVRGALVNWTCRQAPQPYRVTLFWFVLCWMAALLALGGLAALQQLVPEDAAA